MRRDEVDVDDDGGTGTRLVAGEMRLWSDHADDAPRPPAQGKVLEELVLAAVADRGRVLVVGPHEDRILSAAVSAAAGVTVVLRSLEDAERVAAAQPTAEVVCGDLAAFVEDAVPARFDAVLALDGVERVQSVDAAQRDWVARVALLRDLVDDGGVLLVGVDNPRSLVAMVDVVSPHRRRHTGDWVAPPHLDATRPHSLTDALASFEALDLRGQAYAALPLATAPTVLIGSSGTGTSWDLRVDQALRGGTEAVWSRRSLLLDPWPELRVALRAGRAEEVCDGWVLHLTRGGPTVPGREAPRSLLDDVPGRPDADVVRRTRGTPVPSGELLADVLVGHVLAQDLPTLRRLVREHLQWVQHLAEAQPAGAWLAQVDRTVLGSDGVLALLDPGWEWSGPGALDPVVVVALHTARYLLGHDERGCWPDWTTPVDLATTLLATIGVFPSPEDLGTARDLLPRVGGSDSGGRDAVDVRRLLQHQDDLAGQVAAAEGREFAHRRLAGHRDRQLRKQEAELTRLRQRAEKAETRAEVAEQRARDLEASRSYLLGQAVRHPSRGVRAVLRRAAPPRD